MPLMKKMFLMKKISGSAIRTIDELIVAISMPSAVLDSAIHQWNVARGPPALAGGGIASSFSYKRTVCIMIR